MDGLAWLELFQSSAKLLKIINPVIWCKKIQYFFNYYCRSPYNVLIYGCSGAGKTEFIRALLEEPVTEQPAPRTQAIDNKKIVFENGRKIRFYDLPGQAVQRRNRQMATEKIARHQIKGIINVVTYGYNNVEENEIANIFSNDPVSNVKESYLTTNRNAEITQLSEWMEFIHDGCGVECVITVITKADIWDKNKEEVMSYYQHGQYYTRCTEKISRVCHTCVYPYCSIISPFGERPMLLSFSERDKQKLHKEFKKELFKIIRHEY